MKLDMKGLEAAQGAFLYGLHLCGVHKDQRPVEIVPAIIRAYLQATSEWQPISTAPKDGTIVLLFNQVRGYADIGYFEDGYWFTVWDDFLDTPTHWMPQPPPPTDKGA